MQRCRTVLLNARSRKLCALLTVLAVSVLAQGAVSAQGVNVTYPSNIYTINVKAAPYNAKGDGVTDDTAAIQAAIIDGFKYRVLVYIPNGTYIVSDTLKANDPSNSTNEGWSAWLSVQGQSRTGAVLKLKNNCSGFTDAANPKAVFKNASNDTWNNYTGGAGNEAFGNYLRNLTVDTGSGNVGAIGVDFQGSNFAAVRDVTIKSTDSTKRGIAGLYLQRQNNGPAMVKNVSVDGFNYGVTVTEELANFTFEYLTLTNQKNAGFYLGGIAAIRQLSSTNTVPAIQVEGTGVLNLLNGTLNGGSSANSAVVLNGSTSRGLLRDISTAGYARVVTNRGTNVAGTSLTNWTSDAVNSEHPSPGVSLRLPVQETPTYWNNDSSQWANVTAYGATPGNSSDDDSAGIQAAMNSGKPVIVFPQGGSYQLNSTVTVPATVKHIFGIGITSVESKSSYLSPIFLFQGGSASDTTVLDSLLFGGPNSTVVGHNDKRTLVMQDIGTFDKGAIYANNMGGGKLFVDNVTGSAWYFGTYDTGAALPMQVWARQWNVEGTKTTNADIQNGTKVWALGIKTEGGVTQLTVGPGSQLEAYGLSAYTFGVNASTPFINNDGGFLSASFATMSYNGGPFDLLVKDARSGSTLEFRDNEGIDRAGGSVVPLYVSNSTLLGTNTGLEANGAFTQTPSGWSEWSGVGGVGCSYVEAGGHSGGFQGAHWSANPYNVYTYQVITGLANGQYTFRAWVKSSGGQNTAALIAKNFGGAEKNAAIPTSTTQWKLVTITNIAVTNGQCEIGFWSDATASGGKWINFDDVEFFKQ